MHTRTVVLTLAKLAGLYLLVSAIAGIVAAGGVIWGLNIPGPSLGSSINLSSLVQMRRIENKMLIGLAIALLPIALYLAAGFLLLRSDDSLYYIVRKRHERFGSDLEKYFVVLSRLMGIIIIAWYLPTLITVVLGAAYFISMLPAYAKSDEMMKPILMLILVPGFMVLVGCYLAFGGEMIRGMALYAERARIWRHYKKKEREKFYPSSRHRDTDEVHHHHHDHHEHDSRDTDEVHRYDDRRETDEVPYSTDTPVPDEESLGNEEGRETPSSENDAGPEGESPSSGKEPGGGAKAEGEESGVKTPSSGVLPAGVPPWQRGDIPPAPPPAESTSEDPPEDAPSDDGDGSNEDRGPSGQ